MNVALKTFPYSAIESPPAVRSRFDLVDLFVDTTLHDVASNFEGVGGGGLWKVYFYKGTDGLTKNFKVLHGVAFWQIPEDKNLLIRCHGPQSIGAVLCYL